LSSPPRLNLREYNKLKNKAKTYISQSSAALIKLTFHKREPLKSSKCTTAEASLMLTILYKFIKASLRA
jgi:hypothetical protein